MSMLQPSTPSDDCTTANSPVVIAAFPALLHSVTLFSAAAATTAIFYDNATAGSGKVLARLAAPIGISISQAFPSALIANEGITVAVTGTGGIANAGFSKE